MQKMLQESKRSLQPSQIASDPFAATLG
jgi:hypothetical protein